MVLGFLAVEAVIHIPAHARKRSRCGNRKRDALIRWAKKRCNILWQRARLHVFLYAGSIKLAKPRDLRTGFIIPRIDEIRRFAAALGCKVAKRQNACARHKCNEFLFILHMFPLSIPQMRP